MKISILANRILEFREINYLELTQEHRAVTEEKFNNLCKEYLDNLVLSNENEEMFKIITNDWNSLSFPIPLMFKTYQRVIEIKPTEITLYSMFVDYLLLYGPDWEEEALEITEHIKQKDYIKALETVNRVDYYKTF
ncbi:hypothetical protein [Paenibacillus sp. Y412MC10]|uniref:hypothetical protein n=1 Tax=Geobacillus sp. (strain Y412MC10) TaxID=481743 RepID=UPI0001787EBB|nr:hypothetical protein [Paenibacillus sp. Y412MC10]ACX64808.1 conserved hypothetical protein [Paenibacillus sp. Y412MC10]